MRTKRSLQESSKQQSFIIAKTWKHSKCLSVIKSCVLTQWNITKQWEREETTTTENCTNNSHNVESKTPNTEEYLLCCLFYSKFKKGGEPNYSISSQYSAIFEKGGVRSTRAVYRVILDTSNVLFLAMDNSQFIYVLCIFLNEC